MSAPAVLQSAQSTNGRWGLALVGPADATLPCRGTVVSLGTVAGMETWRLIQDESAETWVLWAEDVTAHGGATIAADVLLQSNGRATILVLGPEAVVEHHGYKRRSSRLVAYIEGRPAEIPAPVLLAMGLVVPEGSPARAIEPPPPLAGAMAGAFAALRRAS